MTKIISRTLAVLAICLLPWLSISAQTVKTGIDVLEENGFEQLQGKRVGLVTNPTGVDRYLTSTIDILHNAPGVKLVALFGPEHGVRGDAHAGEHVEGTAKDPKTGVPIFSLYGKTRLPSSEQFQGLDAIVYDIQDIGCRSYTYISTMGNVMKVAAMEGVEMIVLDRPNPLGGLKVEGCGVEEDLRSFVGQYDIPYIYGLTCGELALLLNGEDMLKVKTSAGKDSTVHCKLTVVKMEGWSRDMTYDRTGLVWIPTSPHIPTVEAAWLYPATGIMGEIGGSSIGVGYTLPFGMIACEDIDADLFASKMNALYLPGVIFRPIYATPFYGSYKGRHLAGVQIHITDINDVRLSEIQFRAMEVLASINPGYNPFKGATAQQKQMFDKVTGTTAIRKQLAKRYRFEDICDLWNGFANTFKVTSAKYHLY